MTGLFGDIAEITIADRRESRLAERRRKAKLAYDATADAWKRATYRIATEEFLPYRATFVFEELSDFYNGCAAERRLPETINGKAFAGLQRRLINEGLIELVPGVMRTRSNGQDGKVYRSNLYVG